MHKYQTEHCEPLQLKSKFFDRKNDFAGCWIGPQFPSCIRLLAENEFLVNIYPGPSWRWHHLAGDWEVFRSQFQWTVWIRWLHGRLVQARFFISAMGYMILDYPFEYSHTIFERENRGLFLNWQKICKWPFRSHLEYSQECLKHLSSFSFEK